MSSENPSLLRSEIKGSSDENLLIGTSSSSFRSRIVSLSADYPTGESQNFHMFTKVIQELNRKLDERGLNSHIIENVDAGFRPLNFTDFFANAASPGVPDHIRLEDGLLLLQENAFKLVLEIDN